MAKVAFKSRGADRLSELDEVLNDIRVIANIEQVWSSISHEFSLSEQSMKEKYMARRELSFHEFVKLLGFICVAVAPIEGDILEIGVWKGKSLAFMSRIVGAGTKVIGIDPCALAGQATELDYFHETVFPSCRLIKCYSEAAVENLSQVTQTIKLLHIDGGHAKENVWADFLLYERFVVPGGYVVFDDYADVEHSPEVGPAVDRLAEGGFFDDFEIIGQVKGYENSFVLRRRP
jgi:cephalosporin hydroxylase